MSVQPPLTGLYSNKYGMLPPPAHQKLYSNKSRMTSRSCLKNSASPKEETLLLNCVPRFSFSAKFSGNRQESNQLESPSLSTCFQVPNISSTSVTGDTQAFSSPNFGTKIDSKLLFGEQPTSVSPGGAYLSTRARVYDFLRHQLTSQFSTPESCRASDTAANSEILSKMNDGKIQEYCHNSTNDPVKRDFFSPNNFLLFTHPILPIIPVIVNGISIFGLVDTGSSSCLLASNFFNLMFKCQPPKLQTISTSFIDCQGKSLEILGVLKNAKLKFGPFSVFHDIIIFKSEAKDFLIGFDLLRTHRITITSKGLIWDSPQYQEGGQTKNVNMLKKEIPLFPMHQYTIMENQQCMINVQARLTGTQHNLKDLLSKAWVCSSEFLQQDTDFEKLNIFFQYVYFSGNGKTKLLFNNASQQIVHLTPNKQVAQAECAEIISPSHAELHGSITNLVDTPCMFTNNICDRTNLKTLVDKHGSTFLSHTKESIKLTPIHTSAKLRRTLTNLAPNSTLINTASQTPFIKRAPIHQSTNSAPHLNLTKPTPNPKTQNPRMEHPAHPFQEICQLAHQFDSMTEQDIADRLSKMEQSFEPTPINVSDINCQSTNPSHRKFITDLILQYKYLFSRHSWDVGKLNASEISLQVKTGIHPIAERSFPVPAKYMASARKLIQRMLEMNVITEGESPWESPLIFVKKKPPEKKQEEGKVGLQAASMQGTITEDHLRLIYDARSLNKVVRRTYTTYTLPKCLDLIHYFRNNRFAAVCDITAAFFTHVLSKNTMKLFSFSFDDKKYLYKRLPMGFIGSTNLFQAHISKVLHENGLHRYRTYSDGSQEGAAAYLDNVLIFARTEETYKILLNKFFDAMSKANYRLKLSKCHFFLVQNFVIFGMELSLPFSTIQPEKKKVDQILSIPIPSTRRKCRSFIGSASFFSKLCPKLQVLMGPLYELTSEKNRFLWTQKHTDAFQATKRALARYPMIHLFDPSKPLIIYTDSCVREHAAYMGYQQDCQTNKLVLVIVGSHRFTTSESHYSQYQCELYALVLFITKHYHLIYGSKLYFLSDCKSLQFGVKFKELNSTILRWWLLLSTLDFTIIFTPATDCLLHLTDLLTRRNNTIKKTNKRLTEDDFSKLQFIDFFNMPPLTLQEIELICGKFNQWIDKAGKNQPPSMPTKGTSKKSPIDRDTDRAEKTPSVAKVQAVTTITLDTSQYSSAQEAPILHKKLSTNIRPSFKDKGTSIKSQTTNSARSHVSPIGAKCLTQGTTFNSPGTKILQNKVLFLWSYIAFQ